MTLCHIDTVWPNTYIFVGTEKRARCPNISRTKRGKEMFSKANITLLVIVLVAIMLSDIVKPMVSSILTPNS